MRKTEFIKNSKLNLTRENLKQNHWLDPITVVSTCVFKIVFRVIYVLVWNRHTVLIPRILPSARTLKEIIDDEFPPC